MGVMGSSLGYSLIRENLAGSVHALVRRPEICKKLVALKLSHEATTHPSEAISGADMVILSIPASAVGPTLKEILPFLSRQTVVSDLCSVKKPVVSVCEKILKGRAEFLSVHPMTGTEKFGYENFVKDLYRDKPCILTPTSKTLKTTVSRVADFWKTLGSRVDIMGPGEHDECAALISHLPHIVSFALLSSILKKQGKHPRLLHMAGGSFRDMTRVAGSSPELWADIFLHNKKELLKSVRNFNGVLDQLIQDLSGSGKNMEKLLLSISEAKRKIP